MLIIYCSIICFKGKR